MQRIKFCFEGGHGHIVLANCEVFYKKGDTNGKDGRFISCHFYVNYSQNYTYLIASAFKKFAFHLGR